MAAPEVVLTTTGAVAGLDPTAQAVLAIVGSLVAIFGSIYAYLSRSKKEDDRSKSSDVREDRRNYGEVSFLERLEKRLDMQQKVADDAMSERNILTAKVAAMEVKLEELAMLKASHQSMRDRLNSKDSTIEGLLSQAAIDRDSFSMERMKFLEIIQNKDMEINARENRISTLESKLHELELALAKAGHLGTGAFAEVIN